LNIPQYRPQIIAYRTGIASLQQLQGVSLLFPVQADQTPLLGDIDYIRQALVIREKPASANSAYGKKYEHEDDIDQGDRGLKKVVIVPGDEFAQFVDKSSKTYAPQYCRNSFRPVVQESQKYDQSDKHEKSAPYYMSDMQ